MPDHDWGDTAPLTDPVHPPPTAAAQAGDDTPIFTTVLATRLLDHLTQHDITHRQILERLDLLMTDIATAAQDVVNFVAAVKAHNADVQAKLDAALAEVAALRAAAAASPTPDPAVAAAVDKVESALADGQAALAAAPQAPESTQGGSAGAAPDAPAGSVVVTPSPVVEQPAQANPAPVVAAVPADTPAPSPAVDTPPAGA